MCGPVLAPDLDTLEVSRQQAPDAAMRDHQQVALLWFVPRQTPDCANDPGLRRARALPAANALVRAGEEDLDHLPELGRRKIARRGPIIFAEVGIDPLRNVERGRGDGSAIGRLSLRA